MVRLHDRRRLHKYAHGLFTPGSYEGPRITSIEFNKLEGSP
jgi:hypothetical protein